MRRARFSGGAGIWMASSLSTFVCMVLLSQCPYSTLCLLNIIGYIDATALTHLPQLRDRLCAHGYARRLSLLFRPVLDLTGEEKLLRALSPARGFDLLDHPVNPGLKGRRICELTYVDELEERTDVLRLVEVVVEAVDPGPEPRARQRPGHDVDHQRERVTLGAAERQHRTLQRFLGVRRRVALFVDRPPFGDRLASLRREDDLAAGHDARGHVQDYRPVLAGRYAVGVGVGADVRVYPAPGRHSRRSVGVGKGDRVAGNGTLHVVRARTVVVRTPYPDGDPAALPRLFQPQIEGAHADDLPHAVVAVDEQRRGAFANDPDVRARVHQPHPQPGAGTSALPMHLRIIPTRSSTVGSRGLTGTLPVAIPSLARSYRCSSSTP